MNDIDPLDPTSFRHMTLSKVEWKLMNPGVRTATVWRDRDVGWSMMYIRFDRGAVAVRHRHPEGEQFVVLSGTIVDEFGRYDAGDFVAHPPGSVHTPSSPDGALALVIWRGRLAAYED